MKAKVLIIIIIAILPFIFKGMPQDNCYQSIDRDNNNGWLYQMIGNESITDSIYGKNFILYYTGHHGHIWSIILSDSTGYHLYNGSTRHKLAEIEPLPFDTMDLLSNNFSTLQWAFDLLAKEAKSMTPHIKKEYSPIYNEMIVFNRDKIVFRLNNTDKFSGCDSLEFNSKLQKIEYLMYWLSSPSIRPYIPIPKDGPTVQ